MFPQHPAQSTFTYRPPRNANSSVRSLVCSRSVDPAMGSNNGHSTEFNSSDLSIATEGNVFSQQSTITTPISSFSDTITMVTSFATPAALNHTWDAEWQITARTLLPPPRNRLFDTHWPIRITISNGSPLYTGRRKYDIDVLVHASLFRRIG